MGIWTRTRKPSFPRLNANHCTTVSPCFENVCLDSLLDILYALKLIFHCDLAVRCKDLLLYVHAAQSLNDSYIIELGFYLTLLCYICLLVCVSLHKAVSYEKKKKVC